MQSAEITRQNQWKPFRLAERGDAIRALQAPEGVADRLRLVASHNRLDIAPDAESQHEFGRLDTLWKLQPATVRILGLGPRFDDASFEQNGHIRVDFGLDTPWLAETLDDEELDETAAKHIQQNVEMLLAFTLSVEKHCNISSRLLWTESGEPLAQKLIDRLQRLN